MAIISRTGIYGEYFGSEPGTSSTLESQEQVNTNALYIAHHFIDKGWTMNAIAGMLGNMTHESGLNPGRWQSNVVGGDASGHGFGLVQWTPYTNYTEWAVANGYSDYTTMDANLARIDYELDNGIQYIARTGFPTSFYNFSRSTDSPYHLAEAFMKCYERPADQGASVVAKRGASANYYYELITGHSFPTIRRKKTGYNFLLYGRHRKV